MFSRIAAAFAVAAGMVSGAAAQDGPIAECGKDYAIQSGDTLSGLAFTVLLDARLWPKVYEYADNRAVIGANPNTLTRGAVIKMPPCVNNAESTTGNVRSVSAAARIQRARPQRQRPRPTGANAGGAAGFESTVEVLTGGDFSPLIDRDEGRGGMMVELVGATLKASGLENPFRVDFVNDRGSHLEVLLKHSKYEFGFPWMKPDCSDLASKPKEVQLRCEYVYSDPIYVVAIDVFGPKALKPWPQKMTDLQNKRLCRPEGRSVDDLLAKGLRHTDNVILVRPSSIKECFKMLERGEVDFVTDMRFPGEKALVETELKDFVTAYPALVSAAHLHLIAHRDNAEASILWMQAFNEGLAKIKLSGEWDLIVNTNLSRFRSSLR